MVFEVADGKFTNLREAPLASSVSKRTLFQGFLLGQPVRQSEGWLYFELGQNDDAKGWIIREDCAEVPDPARSPLSVVGFVTECVIAEWDFTASEALRPSVVSADFLIARAIIETGLTDATSLILNSDGVGPLQVSTKEWQDFTTRGGELAKDARPSDRNIATLQIRGAAFRMFADAQKMSELQHSVPFDPFVPSYLDLFFAYLTDSPAAALAIRDMRAANPAPDPSIEVVLRQPHGPFNDAELAALLTSRKRFFLNGANPKTLGALVTDVKTVLDSALADAFAKIKQHMPEAEPTIGQGGAPWFAIAEAEEAKNVDATNPASTNTILEYFNATDHGRPAAVEPWCGAFAAHCMKTSGNPIAKASIPRDSAAAASWKTWGDELPISVTDIPRGAVIVLSPSSETGGTGHIGFFDQLSNNGKSVKLLGGNQSKKVTRTDFPKDQIASIRWLEVGQAEQVGHAKFKLPAALFDRQDVANKIIAKFAAAGYGPVQQIAALANAIAESRLKADAHNTGEDSVGLFQLRRIRGVGGNHPADKLKDPDFNIELIIAEARRFPVFENAASVEKAVDAFVRFIERPKKTEVEIANRIGIARALA